MNERFLLYQRSNLTLGFSYEEIPIFIIPKYARNTFLQAYYTITHHCNKPIFPIMFLFAREK